MLENMEAIVRMFQYSVRIRAYIDQLKFRILEYLTEKNYFYTFYLFLIIHSQI